MDYGQFDEQVARLHPEIKKSAERFVLLKLGNMRGLDLGLFEFDYDLTWAALLFDPDGNVLGRFGGRDADTPGKYHSLPGLRYSLDRAWERFERGEYLKRPRTTSKNVEDYPAARCFSPKACFHCHNVSEFRREEAQAAGTWRKHDFWVYPEPISLGLTMDVRQGNKVQEVKQESAAARLGLQASDVLNQVHGKPTASVADVQHALHQAPATGTIRIDWHRAGRSMSGELELPKAWRHSDLSWRWSLKSQKPAPPVQGEDLSRDELVAHGLPANEKAFRQGAFVLPVAQQAGIRIGDVIVGVDGKKLDMTARQFEAFVRLNYQVGDTLQLDILRGPARLRIAIKLPG